MRMFVHVYQNGLVASCSQEPVLMHPTEKHSQVFVFWCCFVFGFVFFFFFSCDERVA